MKVLVVMLLALWTAACLSVQYTDSDSTAPNWALLTLTILIIIVLMALTGREEP